MATTALGHQFGLQNRISKSQQRLEGDDLEPGRAAALPGGGQEQLGIIYSINDKINSIVWGPYMIFLLVGVGIFLTVRLKGIQFTKFRYIIKNTVGKAFSSSEGEGAISSAKAGLTSIAAVVGTGNIAGVATAIAIGGPGAVFWMWVSAIFGMATKFSEITLGLHFREKKEGGTQ